MPPPLQTSFIQIIPYHPLYRLCCNYSSHGKTELAKQNLLSGRMHKGGEVDTEFLVTDNLQRFRK